jgi:hypothetical protein
MRSNAQGLADSEHVPCWPRKAQAGVVQQTAAPAVWQPLAPLEVPVDTPSWQEATVRHVPKLPLPSLHEPPGGVGVGAACGTGVAAGPPPPPAMQHLIALGYGLQPVAPCDGENGVPEQRLKSRHWPDTPFREQTTLTQHCTSGSWNKRVRPDHSSPNGSPDPSGSPSPWCPA